MDRNQTTWKSERPATLRDVAEEVGVSVSLASFVLNGSRTGTRVSAKTRQAVLDAADRLGYRPNAIARMLNTGRSNRIGVYSGRISLDSRNAFVAELLGGVFEGAREHGLNTLVHSSGEGHAKLLELVSDRALDGLILYAAQNDPILDLLGELKVPAVAVADAVEGLPSICVDDRRGAEMMADYLCDKGHRHILLKVPDPAPRSAAERASSFVVRCNERGCQTTVHSEIDPNPKGLGPADLAVLQSEIDPATAVFCWNDGAAYKACATARTAGLTIPDDVAITGFDGFTSFVEPKFRLTTIEAPWSRVGEVAAKTLSRMLAGESVPLKSELPVLLCEGETA